MAYIPMTIDLLDVCRQINSWMYNYRAGSLTAHEAATRINLSVPAVSYDEAMHAVMNCTSCMVRNGTVVEFF